MLFRWFLVLEQRIIPPSTCIEAQLKYLGKKVYDLYKLKNSLFGAKFGTFYRLQ
jgi:hypothetical protein